MLYKISKGKNHDLSLSIGTEHVHTLAGDNQFHMNHPTVQATVQPEPTSINKPCKTHCMCMVIYIEHVRTIARNLISTNSLHRHLHT